MIAEMADGTKKDMYDRGFRLGFIGSKDIPGTEPSKPYINNHLRFIVKYHRSDTFPGSRIVGFEVEAYSVKHTYDGTWNAAAPKLTSVPLRPDLAPMLAWSNEVIYTYDVVWEHSPIAWASRWDLYLYMGDDQVHWFSILNSLVIVLLLSGIVAMIMVRTLRRDLAEYNSVEEKEELLEESGWKLVHADVLRPPPLGTWLATTIGTGMQLLCMSFISIGCAMLGFLSPANRGSMLTVTLLLFALMGVAAGYCAALTYKSFKGSQWKSLTLLTAFLYPGIVLGIFFVLNFFIWGQRSSGAVPFGTMFAVLCIWFLISFPLVWVGVWLGYRASLNDPPVKTNMVPRVIPLQAWYLHPLFTMVIGGILPFGAVFIELYFIMSSVWLQRFYYVFGFLALVVLILIITCAEMAIVLCYFQLCNENYQWQWRSFLNTGSAGVFLFGAHTSLSSRGARQSCLAETSRPLPHPPHFPTSRLFLCLLLVDAGNHGLRLNDALLFLHVHLLAALWHYHGHHWVCVVVLVCSSNLWRRQGGLGMVRGRSFISGSQPSAHVVRGLASCIRLGGCELERWIATA